MIPPYNPDIFQRIYHDVQEIKDDLELQQQQEHEWIDFEEVQRTELINEQFVVDNDIDENLKKRTAPSVQPFPKSHLIDKYKI